MHLEKVLRYAAEPDAVAALLADPEFVAEVCAASGAHEWTVDVTGDHHGAFTVVSSRQLPVEQLPEAARHLLGRTLRVRETDRWRAPDAEGVRSGTVELDIPGAPVRARATMTLAEDDAAAGPRGAAATSGGACSVQVLTGQIHATVPLLGARVERVAQGPLLEALDQLEETARRRLGA